ncbi:MAG: septum formation inhibitor Maf [Gordonia sp.]|uniref:Maf family protein n=1 Tax=Gordonia sp. (in: high G+C Gram-positive bacteria) TaxID=84139 RepID=UPI000C5E792B|nr:nucleoside triphosphate pyrophosphatase [Gordonia sp. (in: high G+C Gram-positive bacteria)]MAU83640.1 septum formation inhibitor Maf [Gordonia sp. (in: high G+C Gram-positive bacteria)]
MVSAPEVVLGSASPARLRVLRDAGLDPRVIVSDVDEDALLTTMAAFPPEDIVVRLAQAKADAVVADVLADCDASDVVVLTCDSMLFFDGRLSGKPHTAQVAQSQWRTMRNRSAELITGHCVTRIHDGLVAASAHSAASTTIRFADVDDATIDAYVATGEPLSVAGAFTLDGLGGWFVDSVDGDPSSVLGIGLPTVRRLLGEVGVSVVDLWLSDPTGKSDN